MKLAIVYSRASSGITAPLVTVEVHISAGLPALNIVGLPEAAVKESKDRVRSALINTRFEFPGSRITVNLAPADLPKEGGRFDLPIALGILVASRQLPGHQIAQYEFTGELALSGELRAVRGVLPVVLAAHAAERLLVVPFANENEAALVQTAEVFSAKHLLDVCAHLRGVAKLNRCQRAETETTPLALPDLADVRGQQHAKRSLEIAAAGKHSLLFMGPPGTGKTMLASRLPSISPPLNDQQSLEVAAIASISSNGFRSSEWQRLPFRAPHHSSSNVALVGGGRPPRPGEISLAHHGILFLDELPEFHRNVLESLREPLESGQVTISRAGFQTVFPAQFQLAAALNPCPCGFFGSTRGTCRCSSEQVQRYLAKLSGPFLDRIDLQIEVPALSSDVLSVDEPHASETSAVVRERVILAQIRQLERQGKLNKELSVAELREYAHLTTEAQAWLNQAMNKFNLSARVYHRIVKVARTIADLIGSDKIVADHTSEALSYRALDRIKKSAYVAD